MISTLLAFAYPGECARLMLAHPGIEVWAPVTALVSLAFLWLTVRLLSRSNFAATASAVILLAMPAFRLGLLHPLKQNFLFLLVSVAAAVAAVVWYIYRGRVRDEKEQFPLAAFLAALGESLFATVALSVMNLLNIHLSALAAAFAGFAFAYWWSHREKVVAKTAFWILASVFAFSTVFSLATADWREGEFADRLAKAILDEMGDREWIVTDGLLDDHLRLAARETGRELVVVSLVRDDDADYRKKLAEKVRERRLAGDATEELALALDLGVLPFVQDWFRADPDAAKKCVVFGAPDLWYGADLKPVPELLFFGADPERKVDWSARWPEFDRMLSAPVNWGSYLLGREKDPVKRLRLSLRRHLGLVANDRAVYLQDEGRADEAFALYRLVADTIDRDNVSALFNLLAMASAKYAPAVSIVKDLEGRMKKIVDDKDRRYLLGALARFYGYVRDPQLFVRLGYLWARSGSPGMAMTQIRRAIDLVPSDRRRSLMNMLASLYAGAGEQVKSRKMYEDVLRNDARNHEALVGMMRLSLLDGDQKQALEYLERAVAAGGEDPRIDVERALVAMMKNDFAEAKKTLEKHLAANADDVRSWSLLASVTMQLCDAAKEASVKAAYEKELANVILPSIEKRATGAGDYYLSTVRAFLLLRKGEASRRAARDAFAAAAKARPDIASTRDIVLGLDISLNDQESAERHAREALRLDRSTPLANYAMGSIALGKDDLKSAEMYLRRAAEAPKPVDLALNDLAETYRRMGRSEQGLAYAEKAVEMSPNLYVAKSTLASILMDLKRENARALKLMNETIELARKDGRVEDLRMYVPLARAQLANGDAAAAKISLKKMKKEADKLTAFERSEYEEVLKGVR